MKFCHINGFLIENWFWFFKVSDFSSNNMLLKNLQLYFDVIIEWVKQICYFFPAAHSKVFFMLALLRRPSFLTTNYCLFFSHHYIHITLKLQVFLMDMVGRFHVLHLHIYRQSLIFSSITKNIFSLIFMQI